MIFMLFIALAAQAAPAASPAAEPLGGPVVPGVCLLSRQAVFGNAKVATAATARLQQLATEAQTEVNNERAPLDKEQAAFQAEFAKLTPEQRAQRQQALEARMQPIRVKAEQRSREIEATRAKVLAQISDRAQPLIAEAYRARKCGLLLDRNSVMGGNLANDLTPDVVTALDAKVAPFSFNRETLPPAPAGTQ
ncbi:OmpH family outer membrane protein [Sphingomonas sp. BT-65]|uniref:OmpH family outer membrane protein n=1 Tax=Sphingomonas sp. BT-65 TaxID=2989821 RepID=UPI002235D8DB|nr:OmpH family outer membrane protein [Sphingomonas sp. BT-65]MCW4460661.1 OmpH family outer membrane protein [Sphingomonas sp. BT-65]